MTLRRVVLPLLLLIGSGLFIYAPALFFGKAFFGEEQMGFYYVISFWVQQSLVHGVPLLWQGAYYGGVSASLDQFVGAWYPLNLSLFSMFGFFFAHHLSICIATTAGLLLSYRFGKVQGWTDASSLTLALSYLSATTFAWLQIGTIAAHSFALLPALLLALWYSSRSNAWRPFATATALGGLALGIGFLAGFMQIVFYDFCIAGAYALFLDWEKFKGGLTWFRSLSTSISYVGMTLIGFLVGVWQFYPSAYLIDLTIRTNTYAIQNAYHPFVTQFVAFFLPPYIDIPFLGGGGSAGLYVGALGFLFVLVGLAYYRTKTSLFFASLYVLILGIAFHLPVLGWLNEHIPPFSHMGGNFRWMVGAAFPVSYLAAAGVEGFVVAPERLSRRGRLFLVWGSAFITAAFVALSVGLSALIRVVASSPELIGRLISWYTDGRTLLYPTEHYTALLLQSLTQIEHTFSFSNDRFVFGVSLWLVACLFFALYFLRKSTHRFVPQYIVAIMCLSTLGTYALQWDQFVPQSLYAAKPALVSFLESKETDPHTYRFLGYVVGDGLFDKVFSKQTLTPAQTTTLDLDLLLNNSNLYWGIERMDGMEPYRTLRANQLLTTVVAYDYAQYVFDDASPSFATSKLDQLYNRDVQRRVLLDEKLRDIARRVPLLSMMNVKYVYSLYPLEAPLLALDATLTIPAGADTLPVYVYENKNVLPRIYIAAKPHFVSSEGNAVLGQLLAVKDFSKETIIECADCTDALSGGVVTVSKYEPGEINVSVDSPSGAWVVVSESTLPGWQAMVDGVETNIYTANYLFQTVHVPAGRHEISFVYRDVTMVHLTALFK